MYLVAPLVITLGLSFVLYREQGKWKPIDLWPIDHYKQIDEITLLLSKGGQGTESSLDMLAAKQELAFRRGFPMSAYSEEALQMHLGGQKVGAPGGGHGPPS